MSSNEIIILKSFLFAFRLYEDTITSSHVTSGVADFAEMHLADIKSKNFERLACKSMDIQMSAIEDDVF